MITRKAIAAAFEVITNDKMVKTVVMFCDTTQMFSCMERVRVTRIGKGQSFAVQLGRLNYAEREYIKSFGRQGKRLPKCWIITVKHSKVVKVGQVWRVGSKLVMVASTAGGVSVGKAVKRGDSYAIASSPVRVASSYFHGATFVFDTEKKS